MAQTNSPLSQIMAMKAQGLSNNQIIQNLQRQGFNNTQIFDAMNLADTKSAVENVPRSFMEMPPIENPVDGPQSSVPMPRQGSSVGSGGADELTEKTEELIETIIEEKWNELIKDVNKIVEWKNRAEQRITAMEAKVSALKDNFDQLHKAVIGKVSEYDKHILDVGTEIQAMEKVFTKILPSFTENVHELSRVTDKIKNNSK
jgi:hypothetical protein